MSVGIVSNPLDSGITARSSNPSGIAPVRAAVESNRARNSWGKERVFIISLFFMFAGFQILSVFALAPPIPPTTNACLNVCVTKKVIMGTGHDSDCTTQDAQEAAMPY